MSPKALNISIDISDVIQRARKAMAAHGPLGMTGSGYIAEYLIMNNAKQIADGSVPRSSMTQIVEAQSELADIPECILMAFADFAIAFYSDALPPAYYEHFKKHGSIAV